MLANTPQEPASAAAALAAQRQETLGGSLSRAMQPFPKEHELTEFFGALPQLCDAGVPWVYNCVTFVCERGADVVHVEIEPASGILRVRWTQDGVERLRLDLNRVAGLRLDRAEGQDVLVASFVRPDLDDLMLRIAPTVHLQWGDRAY